LAADANGFLLITSSTSIVNATSTNTRISANAPPEFILVSPASRLSWLST
jgi:hypothetical protein